MVERIFKTSILLLTLTTIGAAASSGQSECRDDWICVDEFRLGENRVEIHARNLRDFPVTYTLAVDTQSFKVEGDSTVTGTLGPRTSERAMLLTSLARGSGADYSYRLNWTVGDRHADHDDDHLYALPYAHGSSHEVLQGYRSSFTHWGPEEFAVDFAMPEGTAVHAARGGIVALVEESNTEGCAQAGCASLANFVVVLHNDGTTGRYYHLKQDGAFVEVGDSVRRGQRIGLSGNTGHSSKPHLHFAVYRASSWGETHSIPIRFQTADGIVSTPRRGSRHLALHL